MDRELTSNYSGKKKTQSYKLCFFLLLIFYRQVVVYPF